MNGQATARTQRLLPGDTSRSSLTAPRAKAKRMPPGWADVQAGSIEKNEGRRRKARGHASEAEPAGTKSPACGCHERTGHYADAAPFSHGDTSRSSLTAPRAKAEHMPPPWADAQAENIEKNEGRRRMARGHASEEEPAGTNLRRAAVMNGQATTRMQRPSPRRHKPKFPHRALREGGVPRRSSEQDAGPRRQERMPQKGAPSRSPHRTGERGRRDDIQGKRSPRPYGKRHEIHA